MKKTELYQLLWETREKIKDRSRRDYGRAAPVCSDNALNELAHLAPHRKEDMLGIDGLGHSFVEKYGDEFMQVLKIYHDSKVDLKRIDQKTKKTLDKLQDRLVNINKRNRLLYTGKLPANFGMDLHSEDEDKNRELIDFLISQRKSQQIEICNFKPNKASYSDSLKYKRLVSLMREVAKDFRESGQYELYVAYPFVIGRIAGDNFNVRAPLALFPVEISRTTYSFTIKVSTTRDILYNNNLILLENKYSNLNREMPDPTIEEINPLTFIDELLKFYARNGIAINQNALDQSNNQKLLGHFQDPDVDENVNLDQETKSPVTDEIDSAELKDDLLPVYADKGLAIIEDDLEPDASQNEFNLLTKANQPDWKTKKFVEYKQDTFPHFQNGEFYLENNVVLGKFSLYSTSIQKDFKKIVDAGELSSLVNELLAGYEQDLDLYGDEVRTEEKKDDPKNPVFKEFEFHYINDLNSSQENAIAQISHKDKLVVQGPPGTGKSQMITSLIADFASKNKNILMVSQKKAALEVIYSRLGDLSKYALFLSDPKDKDGFYRQMEKLISIRVFPYSIGYEISKLANAIEEKSAQLEQIAEKLFTAQNDDLPMYKVYQESGTNQFKGANQNCGLMFETIPEKCFAWSYRLVKDIYQKCGRTQLLKNFQLFNRLNSDSPWLKNVLPNLSNYQFTKLMQQVKTFVLDQRHYWQSNWIKRLFTKRRRKLALGSLMKTFFRNNRYKKLFFNQPEELYGVKDYFDFLKVKDIGTMLDDEQKVFCQIVFKLAQNSDSELADLAKRVFDFLVINRIAEFERENRLLFETIADFREIVTFISQNMREKRKLAKEELKHRLQIQFKKFVISSKRFGELARNVTGKRRPGVSKFINKFHLELFQGIKVWLMTPEVVSEILPPQKGMFDLVVFDEGSQIYVEKAIPSILRGQKVLVAGDNKQLRPSSLGTGRIEYDDETENEDQYGLEAALEEESLLDLARAKYDQTMLDYHYRSKYEELIAFSNYAFYGARLRVSPNFEKPTTPPIEVIKVPNGIWLKRTNHREAAKVLKLLKQFLEQRQNQETIGIITFNSAQRDLILDLIEEECRKSPKFATICKKEFERKSAEGEDLGLFVKNIENVQGDERDTIIFSFAYAKNESGRVVRHYGWLNQEGGENRLNVAITRAKTKIYLVTSLNSTELRVDDLKGKGPKLLKKYLEYAEAISESNPDKAQNVLLSLNDAVDEDQTLTFDSDFEAQVYEELVALNFKVETQVGIGGYRIDLAIKSQDQSQYVLGIECDGKLYHSSKTARERDVHRQAYLESRGWKIHRIWSPNWWRNKKAEIQKIALIVQSLEKTQEPRLMAKPQSA